MANASTGKSATVEVLTAEVRVLMVGSRQVTMSVYNQLDHRPYVEVTPFGRVRPKDGTSDEVHLVGVDTDGTLVRTSVYRWRPPTDAEYVSFVAAGSSVDEVMDRLRWAANQNSADSEIVTALVRAGIEAGLSGELATNAAKRGTATTHVYLKGGGERRSRLVVVENWAEASAYPLIVLAGLR